MAELIFQSKRSTSHTIDICQCKAVLQDKRGSGQFGMLVDNRTVQRAQKPNKTGLPEQLKTGIGHQSGMSVDHVRVHYNSSQPAQFNALAYAQGRAKPTMQAKGVAINDNQGLELEADAMGGRALVSGGLTAQMVRDNFKQVQRAKILARNKKKYGLYTCEHCGFQHGQIHYATYKGKRTGDGGFQVDHITPASKGGRALVRNSRVLCGTCNTSRGNRAGPARLGINKYRGIHKGKITKNYKIKRRKY